MAESHMPTNEDGETGAEKRKMKPIWFLIRRFDIAAGTKQLVMLKEIQIPEGGSSKAVKQNLLKELQLNETDIILKLRNQRGSLIIPKGNMPSNTKATPYSLDINTFHQTIKPREKTVELPEYNEILLTTIDDFVARIARMEKDLPELEKRKEQKFERDMQELEKKLAFLQQRFDEADKTRWEGNLRKNPLW